MIAFVAASVAMAIALTVAGCTKPAAEEDRLEKERAIQAQSKLRLGGSASLAKDTPAEATADN
ncbi:hypothetical protein OP10G_1141 [Fimbriimonas ginsengisoli Gsoil 348]|uniref:Lipoprotein n=1 Tax=Fimbriimonas ginsengisoli Gsoil 348 TaxID=661478 RepID=A0A068NSD3_FIMGI|nr:hypothetical protein OP10G_1141 [Fimbriimonas ginsengisoli Gsoil 348]